MQISQNQPFPVLIYSPNPSFYQIGQTVYIAPYPGTNAASYAVTSGTLPAGLTLNPTSGLITGTPTTLGSNIVTQITATFQDETTYISNLTISIIDIPIQAQPQNQASVQNLTALAQYHFNIFINDTNTQILNAVNLGQTWVDVNLPSIINYNEVLNYFQSLNYSVQIVNWRSFRFQVNTPQGEFYNSGEYPYGSYMWGYPFFQTPAPGYPFLPKNSNRIRITWNPFPISQYAPYYF